MIDYRERITIEPGSRVEGRFSPKDSQAPPEIRLLAHAAAE